MNQPDDGTAPSTVLCVDDETNIRRVLSAMLKRDGYEVTAAADGEQALAAMHRAPVDVVVTDLVMPRMGGLDLLRHVDAETIYLVGDIVVVENLPGSNPHYCSIKKRHAIDRPALRICIEISVDFIRVLSHA